MRSLRALVVVVVVVVVVRRLLSCKTVSVSRSVRFSPRDAMHKRGYCRHAVSVCLSVCHVREFCQN